jgi:hypothetical protein
VNLFAPGLFSRSGLRGFGLAIAIASVIAPALPLGPLFAQPPLPLAALWAAYGWAAEEETSWRAPAALAALGLAHDQMAGGPYGLFMSLYLIAFLVGRVMAVLMSAPNLLSLWGGFAATALASVLAAALIAPWAIGRNVSVWPYAEAAAITVILFPIVRPLYMSATSAARSNLGARAP